MGVSWLKSIILPIVAWLWCCSNKDVDFWCAGESSSEDEAAYDEDDENAESNWRNDYPDDDPMYFERLHLDDYYSSDDGGEYYLILCSIYRVVCLSQGCRSVMMAVSSGLLT